MFTKEDCSVVKKHNTWREMSLITEMVETDSLAMKILDVSKIIFRSSFRGPADTILINEWNLDLLSHWDLKSSSTGIAAMSIEVDNEVPDDLIFIYNKKVYENILVIPKIVKEPRPMEYINGHPTGESEIGEINFRIVSTCTEEEISEYRRNLVGCIELT